MDHSKQAKKLSVFGRLGRSFLKRFMYSQFAVISGFKIAIGKGQPLMQFTVEKDPPSIYWAFRILPAEIERLQEALGMPPFLSLCPVKCLETDEPAYLMVINAYRVSGLAKGIRAEWSVFVREADGPAHYMVIDARSSQRSVDPIDIITPATTVVHEKIGSAIRTQIGDGDEAFHSTVELPADAPIAKTSAEWLTANDYVYWPNGVRDRTFYAAGLSDAQQLHIGPEHCAIRDGSFWSQFVQPEPAHVFVLNNAIEFVISPWENIDTVHRQ